MYDINYSYLSQKIAANQSNENQMHTTIHSDLFPIQNFTNKDLLVIIFTTLSESMKKNIFFENTIRIWALMKPLVQPVLYCHDKNCLKKWTRIAESYGWHIYKSPVSNEDKIPLLKHMYLHAIKNYNSSFYGYCNGDILFDESFLQNFHDLQTYAKEGEYILVIGQRSNYPMEDKKNISTFHKFRKAYRKSKLFTPWGIDYFMYTKNSINWENIPNFVVGRF